MKMADLLIGVASFAFTSRLIIFCIQIFANALIPDHNAGVFDPPVQTVNNSFLDSLVDFSFGGLRRWDAIYFTHIAQYGYTYENCVAFFPFYPLLVSLLSRFLFMIGILQLHQCTLVAGVVLNCILFSIAASYLYILSFNNGLDKVTSLLSVVVFCLNPASIFMTAPYSESMYFFLLTFSLVYIKKGFNYLPSFTVAISILTRSNGLIGIGFVLHSIVQNLITDCITIQKRKGLMKVGRVISIIIKGILKIIICFIICVSSFVLYQYYIYTLFCFPQSNPIKSVPEDVINYGRLQGYKVVGDSQSPWCFKTFPISYSYIQEKHWGFGFLRYYQLKQIPNFLLAFPVVLLSINACIYFYKMNSKAFYTLGLIKNHTKKVKSDPPEKNDGHTKINPYADQMVVYTFHLAFLTIFGCCFVHIQVLTRLLFSSTPLLYWYAATVLRNNPGLNVQINKLLNEELKNDTICFDQSQREIETADSISSGYHMKKTKREVRSHISDVSSRRPLKLKSSKDSDSFLISQFDILKSSLNIFVQVLIFIARDWTKLTVGSKMVMSYFVLYFIVGTVMFSNFLPWT